MRARRWTRATARTAAALVACSLLVPAAGALAAGAAPLPIGRTVLVPGDMGPAVRVLQGDLRQFGFNPGLVNGRFDAQTERALGAYQASRGLPRSGVLNLATLRRLLADFGVPTTAPLPIGSTVLRPGDAGPAVRMLQGDLQQFGFHPGPADGVFGPRTEAALLAYQSSRHLSPTGVLDAATFRQLASAFASGSSTPAGASGQSAGSSGAPNAPSGNQGGTQGTTAGGTSGGSGGGKTGSGGSTKAPSGTQGGGQSATAGGTSGGSTGAQTGSAPELLAYWSVYGSPAGPLADLSTHAAQITWLAPYWYTLTGSAGLRSHETDHAQVDSTATRVGVPILPLINQGTGVTQLLATASGRTRAAAALGQLVRSNAAFDGVVIDFEVLPASSQTQFTDFIQAVRNALPSGDILGVAVMPKASSPGPSYARVFNYSALGQIANFIQIMTYDRHSDGGPAGPVSPTNWVAQVARYAASVIPPHKILIGVPGYGYNWVGTSAATVTDVQAAQLAASLGITPTLDSTSGEYHFSYTRGGVLHTVWYESPQGFAGKEQIVKQYGLAGMALWTLGGEPSSFWSNIGG